MLDVWWIQWDRKCPMTSASPCKIRSFTQATVRHSVSPGEVRLTSMKCTWKTQWSHPMYWGYRGNQNYLHTPLRGRNLYTNVSVFCVIFVRSFSCQWFTEDVFAEPLSQFWNLEAFANVTTEVLKHSLKTKHNMLLIFECN